METLTANLDEVVLVDGKKYSVAEVVSDGAKKKDDEGVMQKIEKDYITVSPIGDDGFVFTRTRKCVGINWEHAGL